MQRVNQYVFYNMGMLVHPLTQIAENAEVRAMMREWNSARDWLETLLETDVFKIVVSRNAVREVIASIDAVIPRNTSEFGSIPIEKKLSWVEAYKLRTSVIEF